MAKGIPGSCARESRTELIEGQLASPPGERGELVQPATRLVIEEALEAESRDALLGRDYYAHGVQPPPGLFRCPVRG